MKVTNRLTHIATKVNFEAAMTEDQLKAAFESKGLAGFPAMLDIKERTEEHVQMLSLGDVTYFPHADDAEVARQLRGLASDLDISADVIKDVCAAEIQEYLDLDAKRDADVPVHSIVECYVGGTAFAWYGLSDYPRLKRVVLEKLAHGGQKAKRDFVLRASRAQVELMDDEDMPADIVLR